MDLVSKSLVEKHEDGTFSIHPLIRDFAREKTPLTIEKADINQLHIRHCGFSLGILSANSENILEGNRSIAADNLSGLLEDILAAWEFAIEETSYELIEKSNRPLRAYLGMRGRYEDGAALFARSREKLDEDNSTASRKTQSGLLVSIGWFSSFCRSGEGKHQAAQKSRCNCIVHSRTQILLQRAKSGSRANHEEVIH